MLSLHLIGQYKYIKKTLAVFLVLVVYVLILNMVYVNYVMAVPFVLSSVELTTRKRKNIFI